MTAYRDFGRKQKREVSLEYLISETPLEPFTTDTYFEQYDQPTVFAVKGQEIVVASKRLADAVLAIYFSPKICKHFFVCISFVILCRKPVF